MKYGKQIGILVYGRSMNTVAWTEDAKRRGLVVVLKARHATLHLPK